MHGSYPAVRVMQFFAGMYWANHYWGMHVFWWIFWVFLVGALVFWAWPSSIERRDLAIERLRQTYASGEITEEEFRHRMAVLQEHREPATRSAV